MSRLVAAAALSRAEDHIGQAVRGAVKGLLDRALTSEGALLAAPVDPHALDHIPQWWAEAVTSDVLPALERAFRAAARRFLTLPKRPHGSFDLPDFRVTAYLALASNRLVGIGDDIWQGARDELRQGIRAGEGIPALRDRLTAYFNWDGPGTKLYDRVTSATAERDAARAAAQRWKGLRLTDLEGPDLTAATEARSALADAIRTLQTARTAADEGSKPYQVRATRIARTEATGAVNAGGLAGASVSSEAFGQPMDKQWISTLDPRTRPDHADADGQRVPISEPFYIGGFPLMHPGDPAGPAAEVVNCRCAQAFVASEDESPTVDNRQYLGR